MNEEDISEQMGRRYARFAERLKANEAMLAADEFTKLLSLLKRNDAKVPPRLLGAMMESWIDLFWQSRRYDLMLKAAEDAIQIFGNDPEWAFARAEALFNMCHFEEAREALEALTHEEFEEPRIFYLLACIAERSGDTETMRRLFQAAHRLDPKSFQQPVEISEEQARAVYEKCLADLPEQITWQIRDVPIFIDKLPSKELLESLGQPFDPLSLGVFVGAPHGTESSWASDQPRIHLFHGNIGKLGDDFESIEEELRITLFHEVGHYLGFDEDQLEEMGLG